MPKSRKKNAKYPKSKYAKLNKMNPFDLLSLAMIVSSIILLSYMWNYLPFSFDWGYHASLGREIVDRGFILDQQYVFAPSGRPIIYPPLMAYIYAGFYELGFNMIDAARILTVMVYAGVLASIWLFLRKKTNSLVACVTIIGIAASSSLFLLIIQPSPIYLVLIAAPWIFYIAERILESRAKKYEHVVLVFLLSIMLYLHHDALLLIALPLLLFSFFYKSRKLLYIVLASLAIFLPWGINILLHLQQMQPLGGSTAPLIISPVLVLFAFIYLVQFKDLKKTAFASKSISMFLVFSVLFALSFSFVAASRGMAYATILLSFLSGLFVYFYYREKKTTGIVLFVILVIFIFSPVSFSMGEKIEAKSDWHPVTQGATNFSYFKNYNAERFLQMSAWIKNNTAKDEIIVIDQGRIGGPIVALTDRKVTGGLFQWVKPDYTLISEYVRNNGSIKIIIMDKSMKNLNGTAIKTFGSLMVLNISRTNATAVFHD
jgi:hypothetical protein